MSKEVKLAPVKQANESIFDISIEMLFIALVFLAPVIFDRRVGIVFSLTKVTAIRLVMIAILTVWAVKLMLKQQHRFIRTPLDYPVLAYLLCATAATLTSVHVITSFMGFYGRYEGLSTLYCYGLLFYVATNFIRTKEQILRVMYTVIIAGICMSVYGVIQRMGLDPYAWGGVVTWQRIIGTIGQPNFLAAYVDMAFIIGLALLLNMKDFIWDKKNSWNSIYDLSVRSALVFSLFLIYVCVLYTQSRGGFLGLFGGAALFFTLANRKLSISKWKELSALVILVGIVTLITSLNPETSPFARAAYEASKLEDSQLKESPIITYSASLSRLETWKSGYKIIADRPVFGIGQEVLKMVFPRFETNKFRFYEGFHVKQDRCHNEVCDMAVTRGIVTLFVYVWILGTFFYLGTKIIKGDYDPELKLYTASFMGASAAYLIQNQFSFGVVAITTFLWIMIGMTASVYIKDNEQVKAGHVDMSDVPWLVLAGTILVAMILVYLSLIQFRADMHFKNGKGLAEMKNFEYAIKEYETSLRISPYEGGTWTHYAIATLNYGQVTGNVGLINKSVDLFAIANKIDPYNADNFYIAGRANLILSMSDNSLLDKILKQEQDSIKIDPYYAECYQMVGYIYERQGKLKEAYNMYEKAVEINPQISEAISSLSNVAIKMGASNRVIQTFKDFLVRYPNNPVFQENLAAMYVRKGDIQNALKVYEDMIAANPKNVRALCNLGFMQAKTGNINKAKENFETAIMVDPKSVDAHNGLGMVYLTFGQKDRARDEFNQSLSVDPNNEYAKQMLGKIK
jgi:tetratricopeptide (TPR) repeat protein